jgi:UDP-N-acetylglucosamine:LPS N-acetylglucosamine transferase
MTKIILGSRHSGHATATPAVKARIEEEVEDPEYVVVTDHEDEYDYSFAEKVYRVPSFRPTGGKIYRPYRTLKNFYNSWKILRKEKPEKVVAYGANTSFPIGLIAGLKGLEVIAVEAENRTKQPSLTPKMLSKLSSTRVWVSQDGLVDKYDTDRVENKQIIQYRDFSDHESAQKDNDLLIIPSSNDTELQEKYWKDVSHEEFLDLMGRTKTVVTRGGMTSYEAANLAGKVIVRPSSHAGGHQKNFAEWLEEEYDNVEVVQDKSFKQLVEEYEEERKDE